MNNIIITVSTQIRNQKLGCAECHFGISKEDMCKYFYPHRNILEFAEINLTLPFSTGPRSVKVTTMQNPSFWDNCPHFGNIDVWKWWVDCGYKPWKRGKPPKFKLGITCNGEIEFTILGLALEK